LTPNASQAQARRRRLSPEERRGRILAAAMELFAERGYEGTSMIEIAQGAGITAAVIYDHFPSKAALQVELLERQSKELFAFIGASLSTAASGPEARLRAGVDAFFRFVEEHPYAWRMMFRDPPSDPGVAAAYHRLSGVATETIASFIKTEVAAQLLRQEDPGQAAEVFAQLLRSAQVGLATWWYENREVSREQIVERLLEFCWVGMERTVAAGRSADEA
jgi:AcrR family transcriptional regulator